MKSIQGEKKRKRRQARPRPILAGRRCVIAVTERAYNYIDAKTRDASGKPTMSMKDFIDLLVEKDKGNP